MLKALPIGLCAVVLVSCGGDEQSAPIDAGVDGSTAGTAPAPSVVLDCADAALGEADPAWRARSTVAGDFGLYGRGRHFGAAQRRRGGDLFTKIPAIASGKEAITLSVPPHERGSVGLYPPSRATKVEQAYTEVRFEPCPGRAATGWPFGLMLGDRDPVELSVRKEGRGAATMISVGRL